MLIQRLFLAAAFCVLTFISLPAADAPIKTVPIQTESGPVIGEERGDVRIFRGIPYAHPPVATLRWQRPTKQYVWTDPRECLQFGPVCPQPTVPLYGDLGPSSEDCLYLNVWTAAKVTDDKKITAEKRPVLFWVHGGGFAIGAASQSWYEGTPLALDGAVVVSCNYRLGPFGFLAHPEIGRGHMIASSGNYGLCDIKMAIEWTKQNIANFGGDPDNITVWGESAGAAAVTALMTFQEPKSFKFQRAIIMSTNTIVPNRYLDKPNDGLKSMYELGLEFQNRLNVPDGPDALKMMNAKTPAEILKAARPGSAVPGVSTTDAICVDNVYLRAPIADQFESGNVLNIPLMIGNVADEGSMFERKLKYESVAKYKNFLTERYGPIKADKAFDIYPAATDADVRPAQAELFSDIFVGSTRHHARAMVKNQPNVFVYHFTRKAKPMVDSGIGVYHGSELPFFFGNVQDKEKYTDEDRELSRLIRTYLISFAKSGNPNADIAPRAPEWPAYTREKEQHLTIDTPISTGEKLHGKTLDALTEMDKK